MKILFFGTPEIAEVYLKELIQTQEVVGIITRPDRPRDRGQKLVSPPVKILAEQNNIPVFQPEKFNDDIINNLKVLNPDVGVVVSYGKLIPENIFSVPKIGCFNIHFSLLPKYRGAAPIQWALINGEKETGVTTFWIEKTLDSGPVLVQKSIEISQDDNYLSLAKTLTALGVVVLQESFDKLKKGQSRGEPQNGTPTFAPPLKKENGKIDWSKPADVIFNLIRGTTPWPGAYSEIKEGNLKGKILKIIKAHAVQGAKYETETSPGQIVEIVKNAGFIVRCGEGFLMIEEVHLENKKQSSAWSFLQGSHFNSGDKIF
ncbi:MAG: methionyl-tRNA formyltransferase [Elusimicrobia bacterium]|nr:methionyl-tRNA formyltransferase [Candidatus Liberimonas magnetica]